MFTAIDFDQSVNSVVYFLYSFCILYHVKCEREEKCHVYNV